MALHRARLAEPRHYLLCLEDRVADPESAWAPLRAFLDLDAAKPLPPRPRSDIADVVTEPWKESALSGVAGAVDSGKARRLFGPWPLGWLERTLADYGPIRAAVRAQRRKYLRHSGAVCGSIANGTRNPALCLTSAKLDPGFIADEAGDAPQ